MGFGVKASDITGAVTAAHAVTDGLIDDVDDDVAVVDGRVQTVDGVVDAVKAKTDNLPPDPADQSQVEAAVTAAHATTDGLVTTVDTVADAIKSKTDNLPSDPADQSDLEDILGRKYPFLDFWSLPADLISVEGTAIDLTFPNVVVEGLPSGATLKRVVVILTIRAILDTSAADNYIDAASKTLRVKKSTGAWGTDDLVGITFDINSLYCVASTKEAGPAIIGSHDVKGEVDGDATYNFMSVETLPVESPRADAISALANDLDLYDVQIGLRVFYE